jgi:hypothetical protein
MYILLKLLFFAVWGLNCVIVLTFFIAGFAKLVSSKPTQLNAADNYVVGTGCAIIAGLLVWAFRLAILQDKLGAGFAVTALSYIGWAGIQLAIVAIIAIKGNWDWK